MRVALVTNLCPHYRIKTFEILAQAYTVDYYFFSAGHEWYWQRAHGVNRGNFHHEYLSGFNIGHTRITPNLVSRLLRGNYDVYLKCINGKFALPATYLVARLRRKPFVLLTDTWMTLQSRLHRLIFPLTRYIYRHSDAVIAHGEHVRQYLLEVGVRPERIFVAPHAVDNEAYNCRPPAQALAELREELHLEPAQRVVLYLGRLEEVKGLPYLLQAFALLPADGAVLVFAGAGTKEKQLKSMARELGLEERVRFAGYVPLEKAILYYAIAYVLVLPSITVPMGKETWGLVINEAFNQGVPAITSDAVGAAIGGLVRDGENGFIVPERNADALARALLRLLHDPSLRERQSENARSLIATWDNRQMVAGMSRAIEYVSGGCYEPGPG